MCVTQGLQRRPSLPDSPHRMDSAQGFLEVCAGNRACLQDAACARNSAGLQGDEEFRGDGKWNFAALEDTSEKILERSVFYGENPRLGTLECHPQGQLTQL